MDITRLKVKQAALKIALNDPELIFTQFAEISAELNDVELKLQEAALYEKENYKPRRNDL